MRKHTIAATTATAALGLGLAFGLTHRTGPTAHVVTASATVPATVGPASRFVVITARPAPAVTTSTTAAPVVASTTPAAPAVTTTTAAPVRPVAASKPAPAVQIAPTPQKAVTAPAAPAVAPRPPVQATTTTLPVDPTVYVFDAHNGTCFATGQAEATAEHFETMPAADCVNGYPVGPQYETPGTPPPGTPADPVAYCQAHPTDTACSAGNGSPR